ncbi:hypothetical protein EGR_10519 [Echinococcus granulosus]|uniref:Uncharacterized protein n=1 Tax=Echinococcus granulosus TaxID=6210 RepID=W6U265_ECHGR|nr:hypothetical protein EGR_10519 [Echinococcus granulosus]EUB54626.1 hypothetical protein EGR_10519 [Echinococcus granulosus]
MCQRTCLISGKKHQIVNDENKLEFYNDFFHVVAISPSGVFIIFANCIEHIKVDEALVDYPRTACSPPTSHGLSGLNQTMCDFCLSSQATFLIMPLTSSAGKHACCFGWERDGRERGGKEGQKGRKMVLSCSSTATDVLFSKMNYISFFSLITLLIISVASNLAKMYVTWHYIHCILLHRPRAVDFFFRKCLGHLNPIVPFKTFHLST